MHEVLRRLDMNLLLVFDALVRLGSVAAAAEELAMSPSACSHALTRLRGALSDPLFVRYGSGMQPTARAQAMAPVIGQALQALGGSLEGARPFAPGDSTQAFVFAATDYTAYAVLPALAARLRTLAPRLRVRAVYSTRQDSFDDLAAGRAHFALGFDEGQAALPEGVQARDGFTDDYVVVARRDHPEIRGSLSLAQYLAASHLAVKPWRDARGVIDGALERQGLRRQVTMELPSLLAAPFIVAGSDLLATLPQRVARRLGPAAHLAVYPAPFAAPAYTLKVLFHARHAGIPGHEWMLEQVLAAAREAEE
ncbi:LysR family transcriptional regulator [Achromobacter insuavis]|uniref:LysR family transcriptional regulator n=1 Tax=Achromobacter insuavis TaxID=1287735 RepID=UPI000AD01522|nr:LysR family transcriptional regulator [Achromobacter insuavis]